MGWRTRVVASVGEEDRASLPPSPPADIDLAQALSELLGRAWSATVRVEKLTRLSGGASRETWAFEAQRGADPPRPWILRRDFPAAAAPTLAGLVGNTDALDRRGEYELCRHLADAGLPVPRPVALADAQSGLGPSFVMECVDGEALPQRILRDDAFAAVRERLGPQVARALARLHALDAERLPPLPAEPPGMQIELCRRLIDLGPTPRPIFELAHRWLREHLPPDPPALTLVHGDFRTGNFLVGPDGLRAILDWEYAHRGDPAEDLAFLCLKPWRFGHLDRAAGGFARRDDFFRVYEQERGEAVDPERVRFWEVLGNLKWGALCVARAMLHLRGVGRSVEVAAIGRRVAETEYDLLELLE